MDSSTDPRECQRRVEIENRESSADQVMSSVATRQEKLLSS